MLYCNYRNMSVLSMNVCKDVYYICIAYVLTAKSIYNNFKCEKYCHFLNMFFVYVRIRVYINLRKCV